jgi:MATE family multidrug resistance protein
LIPTNKDVWRIAAPMILSNISVPLLGMVDTGVTGHLDDPAYLGAVAIGSTIFSFLFMGVNFLRMGTTGITAQHFGADDHEGLRVALGQAVIVALAIAFVFLILQQPIRQLSMGLLGPDVAIRAYAEQYFSIRIWSAPAILTNLVLIGWFIGLQNVRAPLVIVLTTNITNVCLDLLFVVVMGMTVDGVATASVIAEYTGVLVGITMVLRELRSHRGGWPLHKLTVIREYAAFFSINANLFLRTMALVFTFSFVTAQSARLGGLVLAANAVLLNMQTLLAFALDGFAHAAEALVGKAMGQKNRAALDSAVAISLRWSLYVAVGFCAFFALFGNSLINLLTDIQDIREITIRYLPWLILSPLVSVWSFLYDGVFVGATRAREMRNIMLLSTLVVFLPSWYLLQPLGNHGLWLAFTLFMASRGIGMHFAYKRLVVDALKF